MQMSVLGKPPPHCQNQLTLGFLQQLQEEQETPRVTTEPGCRGPWGEAGRGGAGRQGDGTAWPVPPSTAPGPNGGVFMEREQSGPRGT